MLTRAFPDPQLRAAAAHPSEESLAASFPARSAEVVELQAVAEAMVAVVAVEVVEAVEVVVEEAEAAAPWIAIPRRLFPSPEPSCWCFPARRQ